MNKKQVKSIQRTLCNLLLSYYSQKSFRLERKEWDFTNKNIFIPFYADTTSGPYMSIKQTIVICKESLLFQINSIIENPLLTNGSFVANSKMANYFGNS